VAALRRRRRRAPLVVERDRYTDMDRGAVCAELKLKTDAACPELGLFKYSLREAGATRADVVAVLRAYDVSDAAGRASLDELLHGCFSAEELAELARRVTAAAAPSDRYDHGGMDRGAVTWAELKQKTDAACPELGLAKYTLYRAGATRADAVAVLRAFDKGDADGRAALAELVAAHEHRKAAKATLERAAAAEAVAQAALPHLSRASRRQPAPPGLPDAAPASERPAARALTAGTKRASGGGDASAHATKRPRAATA
jgi:hypothetical protein